MTEGRQRKWWWQAFPQNANTSADADPNHWIGKITRCIPLHRRAGEEHSETFAFSILAAYLSNRPDDARQLARQFLTESSANSAMEAVFLRLVQLELHRPDSDADISCPDDLGEHDRDEYRAAVCEGRFRVAADIARIDPTTRLRVYCQYYLNARVD